MPTHIMLFFLNPGMHIEVLVKKIRRKVLRLDISDFNNYVKVIIAPISNAQYDLF